ncbi:hypothetical protein [Ferruginibacter albus]|uniref:hypothetical protein n=1 Tax=Ferruginibacter albus TaxID=2875540 RepID=UPI001CC3F70C|nr:hypothetical protein [Ferruginibacter albus]UAY52604.1 hypothetical protein K9M53_02675 [Ferruginibacter albus]
MESAGFIVAFVGAVYLIFPGINLRFSSTNPVTQGRVKKDQYIKSMRLIGVIGIGAGTAILIASYFI